MLRAVRLWLFPARIGQWERALRALAIVGFVLLAVRSWRSAVKGSYDFDGFHREATYLLEHGELSRDHAVERYLPHFQVLHVPFALLPIGLAGLVWYLISVAALLATPRQIERLTGVAPRAQFPAWFVALPFVIDNLHLGQSALVLLWVSLWGTNRVRDAAAVRGGAALGFVALFKIPALAMTAPAVLLGRPLRVLAGFAATVVVLTALLFAAVGVDDATARISEWAGYVRHEQSPAAMVETDSSLRHNNQSLPITLARTFGEMPRRLRRDAIALTRLPLPTIWTISAAITGVLALLGLACVVQARRRRADDESWIVVTALSALGMLLVSPLVWTHYFLWALPGLVALRARPRVLLVVGGVSVLCLTSPVVRDFGPHLWLSVALFVTLAVRFLRAPLPDSLAATATAR